MLTYIPETTATGYSGLPSVKSDSRLVSNPDGTFDICIWAGDAAAVPDKVSLAIYDYNKCVLWADSTQSCVFKTTIKDSAALEFKWNNSYGTFAVGTIFMSVLVNSSYRTYEIVIQDSPLMPKINSAFKFPPPPCP